MKIEKINENQIRCTLTREDLDNRQIKLSELAYGSDKAKELFRDMMIQAQDEYGFEADNIPLMIEAIPITPDSIVLIVTKVEDPEELDTRFSKFTQSLEEETSSRPDTPVVSGADDILDLFQKLCESKLKKTKEKSAQEAKTKQTQTAPPLKEKPDVPEKRPDLIRLFSFPMLDTVIAASRAVQDFYDGENILYKDKTGAYLLLLHQTGASPEDFNKICNILSEYGNGRAGSAAEESYLWEHGEVIVPRHALQQLSILA